MGRRDFSVEVKSDFLAYLEIRSETKVKKNFFQLKIRSNIKF